MHRLTVPMLLLALAAAPHPAAWARDACRERSLDILLTNDDGYDSPGIRALLDALRLAGHTVTLVAPASNQSGTSAALTPAGVTVRRDADPAIYAVTGTPATAVLVAVTALRSDGGRPDLVVSGINNGSNLGTAIPISGTVGATVAALRLLSPPVPGIAVSTDRREPSEPPGSPANLRHFAEVADFTARLVSRLQRDACRGGRLLDGAIALNVNYPPREPSAVRGVRLVQKANAGDFRLSYRPAGGDAYAASYAPVDPAAAPAGTDAAAYHAGYVTIVPLDADYAATRGAARRSLYPALRSLEP